MSGNSLKLSGVDIDKKNIKNLKKEQNRLKKKKESLNRELESESLTLESRVDRAIEIDIVELEQSDIQECIERIQKDAAAKAAAGKSAAEIATKAAVDKSTAKVPARAATELKNKIGGLRSCEDTKPKTFRDCFAGNPKPAEILGRIVRRRTMTREEAIVENNSQWCTLLNDVEITREAHHAVLLKLGRREQLKDSLSESDQLKQKYRKRGNSPFDRGTPEEITIAKKELKNQKHLLEKDKKLLELQNRLDQVYQNGDIEEAENYLSRLLDKRQGK